MAIKFGDRLRHAWNAFRDPDPFSTDLGPSSSIRPDRIRFNIGNEMSIVNSIYTRISVDTSAINIRHVRLDENGRYLETISSGLNECLSVSANIDQTARAFMQDIVLSMFDEGSIAILPVDTTYNPKISGAFDVQSMRVGKITQWFPAHVRVEAYNDQTGRKEEKTLPKSTVAIVENPLYSIMNGKDSVLQRLITKLNLLDTIDISNYGRLDIILQMPYTIKTPARVEHALARVKSIEDQLASSKHGIAYVDATEKITQLNRPAENNLMEQIEFLTSMLYSQLGLSAAIFDGTADEKQMINYHTRTVEPILLAITDAMSRTFLTKTARTQGQSIMYFRDPFKLVPATELATIGDSLTRNAILTSNEMRAILNYKPDPSKDANSLRNKNLNPEKGTQENQGNQTETPQKETDVQKGVKVND